MVYIIQHAEDRVVFVDTTFIPVIAAIRDQLPSDLNMIVMTDADHMPESDLQLGCYEDLLAPQSIDFDWPELPEDTAAGLCYTSGTTGNPKGALYSHRSTVLHAYSVVVGVGAMLSEGARVLPVVPLFHVNAWGLPYTAPMVGASLIFPGGALDGASLFKLMDAEKVSSAWGVPTVWQGLAGEIANQGRNPDGFSSVVVGGSAAPRSMIEGFEKSGVSVCHAWGMTEMSPIGTQGNLPVSFAASATLEERLDLQQLQGRRVHGVELKIVDEDGVPQPHDGEAVGELYVRGNNVISGYFNNEEATADAIDADGWFGTGDIASISADGYLMIQDRAKDLIKSGGEWISSIDVENAVASHPDVMQTAVVGIPHPKWDERPLLFVVSNSGNEIIREELDELMLKKFEKWQLPDQVVFLKELPIGATGKVKKIDLREEYKEHYM